MNREDAGTTTFDAGVAEYLDKQPDGSKSWLLLRWDLVQLYGTVKAFRRRSREQPAKRAQHCRKRAKTAASIAFLMGSLLVLTAVLGWRLTAFSPERSVIAKAGTAVAVAITVVLVFGYALVLVHAFVDRRNRNLMIWRREGSTFAAVRIEAEHAGRRQIHGLGRWPIRSESDIAERLRRDVADMARDTGTVLTTDNVPPALRKKYLEEGMTPATPNECEVYALEPSDDPLIFLPKGRSTP